MIASLLLLAPLAVPPADDWPHFGGPARTNVLEGAPSSFRWGSDGPPVEWRVDVGPGFGGVAVRDGEVFLLDRERGKGDVLRVFDLERGRELWSVAYPAQGRVPFAGSRSVPAVTDKHVVTLGGFGHVTCFSRKDREPVWSFEMEEAYGGRLPVFGWSGNPLVLDDAVVVLPVLGEDVGLVALDVASGKEVWKTEGVGYSHSTPTVLSLGGRDQLLFLSTPAPASGTDERAPTRLTSFDPKTGRKLWSEELDFTRLPIPAPIRLDDERILLTGGYRGGTLVLKVGGADEGFARETLFHVERGSQTHLPILKDGHVYMLANENWNEKRRREEGGLLCMTLDGKELWRTGDDPYVGRGSLLLVGDHLLTQDGYDGTLRIAKATPEGYEQVAEATLLKPSGSRDGQMWAPMALSGRRLLMRSQGELVCVQL